MVGTYFEQEVNCSTNFQTLVALASTNVSLTYLVTSVEVSGEKHRKRKNMENLLGRLSWARARSGVHNFHHVLLGRTQSCGAP